MQNRFSGRRGGARRQRSSSSSPSSSSTVLSSSSDESSKPSDERNNAALSVRILKTAQELSRAEGRRLHFKQRTLMIMAIIGVSYVTLRGLLAIAFPPERPSPAVAAGLLVSLFAFAALIRLVTLLRGRLEALTREIQILDLTREALEDKPPRVEIRPHRDNEGNETPLVVIRTETMKQILRQPR